MSIRCFSLFFLVLLADASQSGIAATDTKASTVHFKLRADSLIVLPVRVNGAGPFDFVVDTGTSETIVDSAIAAKLQLPATGSATMTLVSTQSSAIRTAHVEKLEVEGAIVKDLELSIMSLEGLRSRSPTVQGILGEDFLRNFDLLFDNRRNLLQMERGPGPMMEALTGERVPLSGQGLYRGQPTQNRLVLTIEIPEITARPLRVQLDSAACLVILFMVRPLSLSEKDWRPAAVQNAILGRTSMYQRQVNVLAVGRTIVQQVGVMTAARGDASDSDGLLPTNLFQSVYVSHSGGFVIFNPARRKMLARAFP